MFKSLKAAETAALAGQGQDLDTQQCEALQEDLLSSSPPSAVVSNLNERLNRSPLREVKDDDDDKHHQLHDESEAVEPSETVEPPREQPSELPAVGDDVALDTQARRKIVRRDSKGLLRPFDEDGNQIEIDSISLLQQVALDASKMESSEMEDLTQKSAMSLTQENPPSAYAQFNQFDIQQAIHDDFPSTATPNDNGDAGGTLRTHSDSLHARQHASARTESTAHTYQSHDLGYIKVEFDPAPAEDEEDEQVSQDPSFPLPNIHYNGHSYDPQTPAPPLNPFQAKGSVMKASQLFGATQPSSIGRHLASPTSSRPSPDVYNDFTSPQKRRRKSVLSSPLAALANDTTPLQSSVRNMLAESLPTEFTPAIPRTSGVQSFDAGPRIQRAGHIHDPRPYMSMKESQERRNALGNMDTDSEGSDSDVEPARPKRRFDVQIQVELAPVRMPRSTSRPTSASSAAQAFHASSSRPLSASSVAPAPTIEVPATGVRRGWQQDVAQSFGNHEEGTQDTDAENTQEEAVEVPSTGRRQSWQEEYIAQCEGLDARDTQQSNLRGATQDDIVADSQAIPNQEQEPVLPDDHIASNDATPAIVGHDSPGPAPQVNTEEILPPSTCEPPSPQNTEQQPEPTHASETTASAPEPSLPLQELSSNRNNLRTPMTNKNQPLSDGSETVPETSPPEERLRPMGEIANTSFSADAEDFTDIPGFTQDVEYEDAMRIRSSPQPPPRIIRKIPSPVLAPAPFAEPVALNPTTPNQFVAAPLVQPVFSGHVNLNFSSSRRLERAVPVVEKDGTEVQAPGTEQVVDDQLPLLSAIRAKTRASKKIEETHDAVEHDSTVPPSTKRSGLRSKNELKGPSRALRRSGSTSRNSTPAPSTRTSRAAKPGVRSARSSLASSSALSSPLSSPEGTPLPAEDVVPSKVSSERITEAESTLLSPEMGTHARTATRASLKISGAEPECTALPVQKETDNVAAPKLSSEHVSEAESTSLPAKRQKNARTGTRASRQSAAAEAESTSVAVEDKTHGKAAPRASTRSVVAEADSSLLPAEEKSKLKASAKSLWKIVPEVATTPLPAEEKTSRKPPPGSSRGKAATEAATTPAPTGSRRTSKRNSGVMAVDDDEPVIVRSSKRHSTARPTKEDSEDPLALPSPSVTHVTADADSRALFSKMAFAVSYVKHEYERDAVTKLIRNSGGRVLDQGFESLFETSRQQESDNGLSLSPTAKPLCFSALIADEHSRKAKYMQALALGLPCISGKWIKACVAKKTILDWSSYLLCAGQSSFLGNAIKSRTLQPYSAAEATLETTLEARDKLLSGKSVLIVTGRGKSAENRKAYAFLTRAVGPGRVGQVTDLSEARKKLAASEAEGQTWDLLYTDGPEQAAVATVFGSASQNGGAKKRKRGSTAADETPSPKRIRVITDETMIQSLILGQLLEE